MPAQANRLNRLPPYVFAVIGDRIRQMQNEGIDVIRLDIGSPDMPPPGFVVEALAQSARNPGNHGYSGYRGIPVYRQAVSRYYQRRFDVTLDPDTQVLPLIGSKEGIVNFALAYLDEGDVVLVPDIGYPSYSMGARLAGAEIYWLPLREENNFLPVFDDIPADIASRAKILWVNYPNNPTGATADLDFYQRAVAFCQEHDVILASDNPYADVTFDGYRAESALRVSGALPHVVEFFSLSKGHNMAGWRMGAAVGSEDALKTLLTVKSNIDSGHFKAMYEAAQVALDETSFQWMQERNAIYQNRRDKILEILPRIGLSAEKAKGSLYVWAKVLHIDAKTYAEKALAEAHVSIAPGEAYGPGGEGYVRISIGISNERLEEALTRLQSWYAVAKQA